MTAPTPLWAMRPEAAALEVLAAAAVELAGAELARVVEPAGVVRVVVAGAEVVLPAGAEVLPLALALALASVEVLARVNGMELGAVAVPVGVIPAM